jgi:hypothetical protein
VLAVPASSKRLLLLDWFGSVESPKNTACRTAYNDFILNFILF